MKTFAAAASLLALLPALATAQRPNGTSICDYYSTALFNSTNGTTQYALLTALVNTAVIGNWTANTQNVTVTGILNPGTYNGVAVNLLPYFNGELKSSNRSGVASSVNFLDGGGATPLMMGMAANNTSSNQYRLLTHLYQYFGALLQCSSYSQMGFSAYQGNTNMYAVHGFMYLGPNAMNYFITQVGLSAASFGVAMSDITAVANALNTTFNYRCSTPVAVLPSAPVEPQSMCINPACPLAANNTCAAYQMAVSPQFVNGTNFTAPSSTASAGAGGASGTSGTATGTGATASATRNAAAANMPIVSGMAGLFVGLLGFLTL